VELLRLLLCRPRFVVAARRVRRQRRGVRHVVDVATEQVGTALRYVTKGDELRQELVVAVDVEVVLGLAPEVVERHDLVGCCGERDDLRGQEWSGRHFRVSLTLGCDIT